MVAGEHFLPGRTAWADVGWKALASNLSDIAAMGGSPDLALVTLMLPPDFCVEDALALYRGLHECATEYGVTLGGGDVVRAPVFAITVALSGHAYCPADGGPVVLRRDTARPGDLVAVTGAPGESAGGLRLLNDGRSAATDAETCLIAAHERPLPRVALGQAAVRAGLRCGIDISDGLVQDLGHVARASRVSIRLDETRIPLSEALREVWPEDALRLALMGGEDYELAVIGPPAAMETWMGAATGVVTVIGEVIASGTLAVQVLDADGNELALGRGGWDHFAGP
jgi:thiamine-monophosphate kinase